MHITSSTVHHVCILLFVVKIASLEVQETKFFAQNIHTNILQTTICENYSTINNLYQLMLQSEYMYVNNIHYLSNPRQASH